MNAKSRYSLPNGCRQTQTIAHARNASSNPVLSPSLQTVLPVAMRVDTEASGVAHKWPPTLSL